MSQAELAPAAHISPASLSLVEQGTRRPSPAVIRGLAEQLGTTPEYLTTGRAGEPRTLEVDLRFGELALTSGDAATAHERFAAALDEASRLGAPYDPEPYEASHGLSRALMGLGDLTAAIRGLEELLAAPEPPSTVHRTSVKVSLCRAYMQSGDLGRAIDLGEAALAEEGAGYGQFVSEEHAKLASTLVLAYRERGDLTRAGPLIDSAVAAADASGSLRARGAAYWNAAGAFSVRATSRMPSSWRRKALARLDRSAPVEYARVLAVRAAALLASGDEGAAEAACRDAANALDEVGATRSAAQVWRELADVLHRMGRLEEAIGEFGRVATALGAPAVPVHPVKAATG